VAVGKERVGEDGVEELGFVDKRAVFYDTSTSTHLRRQHFDCGQDSIKLHRPLEVLLRFFQNGSYVLLIK